MNALQKLLVPLDGTRAAAEFLPLAHTLARRTGAAITLARVVPRQPLGPDAPRAVDTATYLARIAGELADEGLVRETAVLLG